MSLSTSKTRLPGAPQSLNDLVTEINELLFTEQELTVSGAVTTGVRAVYLNHATVVVAATIADASTHQGIFLVKDSSASGTAAHTLTLTSGTFDGTNNIATLNAPGEFLLVYFDANGAGTVLVNNGSVALST